METVSAPETMFREDVTVYRALREAEASAADLQAQVLCGAAMLAKGEGRSVRSASADLRVSPSAVSRSQRAQMRSSKGALVSDPGSWSDWVAEFQRARSWAEALRHERDVALRLALVDGKEGLGMSLRKIASVLGLSHATAARAYLTDQIAAPVWADKESLAEAARSGWRQFPHRPEFSARVPYEWEDLPDGSRTVRLIPVGRAIPSSRARPQ